MGDNLYHMESDKALMSRIDKELKNLNTPKNSNNPINKWAKELNRHFTKYIQSINKYMTKCSTSLAIREIQIKTKISSHFN